MTRWPWPFKGTRARVITRLLTRVGRSSPRRSVVVLYGQWLWLEVRALDQGRTSDPPTATEVCPMTTLSFHLRCLFAALAALIVAVVSVIGLIAVIEMLEGIVKG